MADEFDYRGAKILAPMAKVGTHIMRGLSIMYGADVVYTEELVDKELIQTTRVVNEHLGTVDYVDRKHRVLFRTGAFERGRVAIQLGSCDPISALKAAERVLPDVAAIDLNMGSPLSIREGMGAALMRKPELFEDILKTLRRNLTLPVTCKIRLLNDLASSVEVARRAQGCGVSALAIHARRITQRSRTPAQWELMREVVAALPPAGGGGCPIIGNGDILDPADFDRIREATGCAAGMAARGAMWNPSIFREDGFLPLGMVQQDLVIASLACGLPLDDIKAVLHTMALGPAAAAVTDADVDLPGLYGRSGVAALKNVYSYRDVMELVGLDTRHAEESSVGSGSRTLQFQYCALHDFSHLECLNLPAIQNSFKIHGSSRLGPSARANFLEGLLRFVHRGSIFGSKSVMSSMSKL